MSVIVDSLYFCGCSVTETYISVSSRLPFDFTFFAGYFCNFFDELGVRPGLGVVFSAEVAVYPVRCLRDNYVWVMDLGQGEVVVVDPSEAGPVLRYLQQQGLLLSNITVINTHKHSDHVGGNVKLKRELQKCYIVGPRGEGPIPGCDRYVQGGDGLKIGGFECSVIAVPGHTLEHVAFHFPALKVLFVGDTLFVLGCGRMFEGDAETYWSSLKKIRDLPDDTLVFCAHEYSLANR
jgi:hydroxyacylglutathione hydrolase